RQAHLHNRFAIAGAGDWLLLQAEISGRAENVGFHQTARGLLRPLPLLDCKLHRFRLSGGIDASERPCGALALGGLRFNAIARGRAVSRKDARNSAAEKFLKQETTPRDKRGRK